MVLKLYKWIFSPPARACMMACELFKVPVQMIDVDLPTKEHRKPEYLKINPMHTIPVLQDDDFILHDSHAILMYLSDVFAKDDSWFPKDAKRRALVSQKLFFNNSILFPPIRDVLTSVVINGEKKLSDKQKSTLDESYEFLEAFLNRSKFLAGEEMTIADLAATATVTTLEYVYPIEEKKYPKIQGWLSIMKQLPVCEKINAPGAKIAGTWINKLMSEK